MEDFEKQLILKNIGKALSHLEAARNADDKSVTELEIANAQLILVKIYTGSFEDDEIFPQTPTLNDVFGKRN